MKEVGTFESPRWGRVQVMRATYVSADGPLAIILLDDQGQKLINLSVNLHGEEWSQHSVDLPRDCFYMQEWEQNRELSQLAKASGLFIERKDLPIAVGTFDTHGLTASPWQLRGGTP
jgi:hypothetical protein